jgi:hypothetical protein
LHRKIRIIGSHVNRFVGIWIFSKSNHIDPVWDGKLDL